MSQKYSSLKNTKVDHWAHQDWARSWSLVSWISYWGSEIEASLVAQMVKNLPAAWEIQDRSLGREDPLEKGMLPTPVCLPGESHGQRSLVGYSPWTLRVWHNWMANTFTFLLRQDWVRTLRVVKGARTEKKKTWGGSPLGSPSTLADLQGLKDCLSQCFSSFRTYHTHFEDLIKQRVRSCS